MRLCNGLFKSRALLGCAFWLAGPSGSARRRWQAAAAEVADPINIAEYDAGDVNCVPLREIEARMHYPDGEQAGRAVVINEAQPSQDSSALLVMLDSDPAISRVFHSTSLGDKTFSRTRLTPAPCFQDASQSLWQSRESRKPSRPAPKPLRGRKGLTGAPWRSMSD